MKNKKGQVILNVIIIMIIIAIVVISVFRTGIVQQGERTYVSTFELANGEIINCEVLNTFYSGATMTNCTNGITYQGQYNYKILKNCVVAGCVK